MSSEIGAFMGYFTTNRSQYALQFVFDGEEAMICLCTWNRYTEQWYRIGTLYSDRRVIIGPYTDGLRSKQQVREILNDPISRLLMDVFAIQTP